MKLSRWTRHPHWEWDVYLAPPWRGGFDGHLFHILHVDGLDSVVSSPRYCKQREPEKAIIQSKLSHAIIRPTTGDDRGTGVYPTTEGAIRHISRLVVARPPLPPP